MKKIVLITIIIFLIVKFSVKAQSNEDIIGKWVLVDIQIISEKGNELTKEQKDDEKKLKKRFLKEKKMVIKFKAEGNGRIISKNPNKQTWEIFDNEIHKTEKESDKMQKYSYVMNGTQLELTLLPIKYGSYIKMILMRIKSLKYNFSKNLTLKIVLF